VWSRWGAFLGRLTPRRAWGSISGLFTALLIALVLASPAAAQAPNRVGVGMVQRKLSLQEAVEMALRNNLEIDVERLNRANAQQFVKAARGIYDTFFRWTPAFESRTTPTASILAGPGGQLTDRAWTNTAVLNQRLPWGSTLALNFDNNRATTTNPFTSLNPTVTSRLLLSFTQPLVRNREIDPQRAEIRIRRKQVDVSDVDFELRNIDVVSRVEQAYWDLVAARDAVEVLRDTVDWAREQLARTKRMVAAGTLAQLEIAGAEAELERRLDSYYAGLGAVTEAENALKLMLTASRTDELWNDEIIPAELRTLEPPQTETLAEAVRTALARRPELRAAGLRQEISQVQRRLAADQAKPQLNLVAGYGNTGLGGTQSLIENPFSAANRATAERLNQLSALAGLQPLTVNGFGSAVPDTLLGGYGASLSNLFSGRFQTVSAGLSFEWSFQNSAAEASLAQAGIAERRVNTERARIEQGVEAQVRNALQALETARQRIEAAEASARAAQERLESENRLFQAGESTNFLVLTRQNEYADSRRRAVVARLDFNKAVARTRQALGTTLEAHNVTIK
jgi:HAE1 family hydrophobic/amphiphilic exporter-1